MRVRLRVRVRVRLRVRLRVRACVFECDLVPNWSRVADALLFRAEAVGPKQQPAGGVRLPHAGAGRKASGVPATELQPGPMRDSVSPCEPWRMFYHRCFYEIGVKWKAVPPSFFEVQWHVIF